MLYGFEPRLPSSFQLSDLNSVESSAISMVSHLLANARAACDVAIRTREALNLWLKFSKDTHAVEPNFTDNKLVWLKAMSALKGESNKLRVRYCGPFRIHQVVNPTTFIRSNGHNILSHTVHLSQLRPYISDEIPADLPEGQGSSVPTNQP